MNPHHTLPSPPRRAVTAAFAWMLSAALLSGCAFREGSRVAADSSIQPISAGSFAVAWRLDMPLEGGAIKQVFLNDAHVFVCTMDNQCYWVDRKSGHGVAMVKAAPPTDTLFAPITLSDRVIFPSTTQLAVFEPEGRLAYRIPLEYPASSSGVGVGQHIFLGVDHANGGRIAAISTHEQPYEISPRWQLMTRGKITARPAVLGTDIFLGSADGGLYAVGAQSREILWPMLGLGYFRTGGPILADVKADKDGIYAASMDTKLYCLKRDSGRINWVYHSGRPLLDKSTPFLTADMVYLYVPDVGVVGVDKAAKEEFRSHRFAIPEARQVLACDENHIYLRNDKNQLVAADRHTGQVLFRSQRSDLTAFVVNETENDHTIYAVNSAGHLFAIRPVFSPGRVGEVVRSRAGTEPLAAAR